MGLSGVGSTIGPWLGSHFGRIAKSLRSLRRELLTGKPMVYGERSLSLSLVAHLRNLTGFNGFRDLKTDDQVASEEAHCLSITCARGIRDSKKYCT